MNVILIAIGLWFIILSLLINTKDVVSAFVFKVIPFFSGLFCIFYAIVNMGILNINI